MTLDEMDKFCAEKIMGAEIGINGLGQHYIAIDGKIYWSNTYKPTIDIAQAFEVLEKFLKYDPELAYDNTQDKWHVVFWEVPRLSAAISDIASLAIVKACIKIQELSDDQK